VRVDIVATFSGFSDRAVEFYAELAANNTRDFWTANKAVYETEVRDPMRALVGELEAEFGPAKLFRPHRDTRFSNDKTPYKTGQAALVGEGTGIGYYLSVDARGLSVGGGFRAHSPVQVARFRGAVDDAATGPGSATSWPDCVRTASRSRARSSRPSPAGTTPITRASSCFGADR
jgi:uncharacterized protein (TIGR02453 family)